MTRTSTRASAIERAAEPGADLTLDPDAAGDGVREWLESVTTMPAHTAAFDTRVDMAPLFTGRASKGIAKSIRRHGSEVVVAPESFLVDKQSHLEPGEEERASAWARQLGAVVAITAPSAHTP
jgi:hypothetical protein